jgi:hypothetical protein
VAQKVQTLFADDVDGSKADGTARFGLDGTDYEIDLKAKHAWALHALARSVNAARRPGRGTCQARITCFTSELGLDSSRS